MPNPTQNQVHVDVPLTNMSIAYQQSADMFAASRVFPKLPVNKQSDKYWQFDRTDWNRDQMVKRAAGAPASRATWRINTAGPYFCDVWALEKGIDNQTKANADSPINLDRATVQFLTQQGLLRREREFASTYLTTGVWGRDRTGVASGPTGLQFLRWDDAASNPIEDVAAEKAYIMSKTGIEPNVLAMGYNVWIKLKDHPDIIDRVKYGQTPGAPAKVTIQAVAALFEVEEIVVSKAVLNSAAEGATESSDFIFGKVALLAYRNPAPALMSVSAGYTFTWNGLMAGGGVDGTAISTYYDRPTKSDIYEIEMAFDEKIVASDVGTFWNTVVS